MDLTQARHIPIIGDDIYNVGKAIKIMSQPCGPDPWIAVQAFFTYSPVLLWSLVKPEPMDFLTTRFGRGHHHRRRRRFRANDVWRPTWTDAIHGPGGKIPIAPGLTTALWRGAMLTERIGWYLLVVDATSDFLINWTTMAWAWSGCAVTDAPYARVWRDTPDTYFSDRPTRANLWGTHAERHGDATAGGASVQIRAPGPKTFSGSARCHVKEEHGINGQITRVYWTRRTHGQPTEFVDATHMRTPEADGPWNATETHWSTMHGPTEWWGYVEWTGGRLIVDRIRASATGAPGHGLEHDP